MSKGTFRDPVIQKILEKYKFFSPIPDNIQEKSSALRKKTLKRIFKQSGKKSFFTTAIISLFYWSKFFGFNFSLRKSAYLFYASASTCVIVIAVSSTMIIYNKYTSRFEQPFGLITYIEGNASIKKKDQSIVPLTAKAVISPGVDIITGKNSSVSIQLANGDIIRLLPESAITIAPFNNNFRKTMVNLAYGSIFSNVIHAKNKIYQVKTPLWTVTVSGTQFMTSHTSSGSTVKLLNGKIDIQTTKNSDKIFPLTANNAAHINNSSIVNVFSLTILDSLELKKLALYIHITNFNKLNNKDINRIIKKIKQEERKIDLEIMKIKDEWNQLNPLDKLRRLGKPITMLHLTNNTKVAGHVVSQTDTTVIVDTGAGVLNIPRRKIVRKIPIN